MKTLIKHLIENNMEEIIARSLANCHVMGMNSIMLLFSPEKTIRLYVVHRNNDMYKNYPEKFGKEHMSLAFRPHHCNLTLEVIKGRILNWEVEEYNGISYYDSFTVNKYKYRSQIKEGEMSFEPQGITSLLSTNYRLMNEGDSVFMKANDIHTVACPRNTITSWLVYEGKEDPNYSSFCYSNTNPNENKVEGLYQPMTEEQIIADLTLVNLL